MDKTQIRSMNLLDLPPEIILLIAESLESLDDINKLTQASRTLHRIVNMVLYDSMDKNKVLHWAARNGRGALISLVLDMGADIQFKDSSDRTALHWAATYAHDPELILRLESGDQIYAVRKSNMHTVASNDDHAVPTRILLDRGADISAKAIYRDRHVHHTPRVHHTPLHWATACGNVAVVKLLLERGADINEKGGMVSYTPLILATINDHERIVRLLLSKGADVKATTMWNETALHWASWAGHEEVTMVLLENGAPTEDLGSDRQTPLIEAVREGREGLVRILLNHGANINTHNVDQDTPLHIAAREGDASIVSLLLSHNAQVNPINRNGATPVRIAAFMGHVSVAALLLDQGADIEIVSDLTGYNLLHTAIAGRGDLSIIEFLLARGVSSAALTGNGQTAVKLAYSRARFDVVTTILGDSPLSSLNRPEVLRNPSALESSACAAEQILGSHDILDNALSPYLGSPLLTACSEGLTDIARILINHGANVDVRCDTHSTPLVLAAENGHEDVVRLLLSNAATVDCCENSGRLSGPSCQTPLHRAAARGHVSTAIALLESGAVLCLRDRRGQTPLYKAINEGEEESGSEMVRFLISRGANPFLPDNMGVTPWDLADEGWAKKALVDACGVDPYRVWQESMEEMEEYVRSPFLGHLYHVL